MRSSILIVEDDFLESYELETRAAQLGYRPALTSTHQGAVELFEQLNGSLAGIICDNRLIAGEPAAERIYRYVRARAASLPFAIYSGFPPRHLPNDDPFLKIVAKPFSDDVFRFLRESALLNDKPGHREAA